MRYIDTEYNKKFIEENFVRIVTNAQLGITETEFVFCEGSTCSECILCASEKQAGYIAEHPEMLKNNYPWLMNNIKRILNIAPELCVTKSGKLAWCSETPCSECQETCHAHSKELVPFAGDWAFTEI